MNKITTEFANALNDSEWMGVIYEAGFGIPFQANYLNIPGASKTILFAGSLYNKAFQPVLKQKNGSHQRSVSNEMTKSISSMFAIQAETTILLALEKNDSGAGFESVPPIFSLAVSGAQSGLEKDSASHGWVNIGIIRGGGSLESEPNIEHFGFHFFNKKEYINYPENIEVTREMAGNELVAYIQWFMEKVLLGKYKSWKDAIDNLPESEIIRVDVIRADDISIEEHLGLVCHDTPVLYDGVEFKRPTDYLRRYSKIYRGSFNPITKAHVEIGSDSIFEISLENYRKASANLKEISHRVREISSTGNPVLITDENPAFMQLDSLLTSFSNKPYKYILGVDTFNAVVSDRYNYSENYLERFYGENSSFIVIARDGASVTNNHRTRLIEWSFGDSPHDETISSTRVRNGELDLVPESIRDMVAARFNIL